jgi:hypothetical protein
MMHGKCVETFEDWYTSYSIDERDGSLEFRDIAPFGAKLWRLWDDYKREMDIRVSNYPVLEKLADGEVISPKADLPNVSSGETAGLIRRIARNLVQNTPNVEIISKFDDDKMAGILAKHILKAKIIGSDQYSNDMQQNLFASTKTALTLGFDCVLPCLLEDAGGAWYMKYDAIHYRDVFPEPGVKDVRDAPTVFVRRYLTKGEVIQLIRDDATGWDCNALKKLLQNDPPAKDRDSVDHQSKKRGQIPNGYEIITWYTSSGDPFLTFSATTMMLLRIEKNKHPLKLHPVHFLVLEKDAQQPLGKSQVELLLGRQDFQDLMLNGAMKLWYRNINPSIIGYGTVNTIPNLSPGKYTQIANPNAKIEAFEVNTQTLMQYGLISQQNLGSMVNLLGSADQQMATQAGGGANGMSATPQGVEAQEAMVDITTNGYQKSIEAFFSHYCSYALTIYFQEMKAIKSITPTAESRMQLIEAGMPVTAIKENGEIEFDFEKLATEYFVRCVPGSLVELEDEKQLRVLNQLFIPLSQAMPALANTGDQAMLQQAASAMQYIIGKQIELSGAASAKDIGLLWKGEGPATDARDERMSEIENVVGGIVASNEIELDLNTAAIQRLQEQMSMLIESQGMLLEKLGAHSNTPAPSTPDLAMVPS